MPRTLSSPTATEIAKPVTTPGYFVEILFPSPTPPFRASSRGDKTWDGKVWITYGMRVTGFATDGGAGLEGTLTFPDLDNALTTLILLYGLGDREINVWKFYGDTDPAAGDPVYLGKMRGNECTINDTNVVITVTLDKGTTLYAPRTYLTREAGFNRLPAPGAVIAWGEERFVLEPDNG